MNIAGLRSIGAAVLLVLLAGADCNRPKRASSESSATPTPQAVRASITAHAPDAFYDPPSADARAGVIAGRATYAGRRTRSIFLPSCRWRRGFNSARARERDGLIAFPKVWQVNDC